MKTAHAISVVCGLCLVATFVINVYIGLYDTTLAEENILHRDLNSIIGIITLAAGIVLIIRSKSTLVNLISGVIWPIFYLGSLAFDVETELCFGTHVNCWPSITDSYDYLILNQSVEGWVLSPYTMRVVIALLILAIILTIISVTLNKVWKTNR